MDGSTTAPRKVISVNERQDLRLPLELDTGPEELIFIGDRDLKD